MGLKRPKQYELVIPSVLERIKYVEDFTEKIAIGMNLSEEDRDSLAIAVTEIVNNAIIHGNRSNPAKKVTIVYLVTMDVLTIQIKDEGAGFDQASLADPRQPENLFKERGRGIFIVKSLMDDIVFEATDTGMQITLVKKRHPARPD